jgi:hypothetical protein
MAAAQHGMWEEAVSVGEGQNNVMWTSFVVDIFTFGQLFRMKQWLIHFSMKA